MTPEDKQQIKANEIMIKEYEKCKNDPHYFATTYIVIDGKPFTTRLAKHHFNSFFNLNK